MARRIEIELTSTREDGTWTWRAAGAKEPRGSVEASVLPAGASVGDVLRVEVEMGLDGTEITAVIPPKEKARREPERLELIGRTLSDDELVTSKLVGKRGRRDRDDDRRGGRDRRGRDGRGGDRGRGREGGRGGRREDGREQRGRGERQERPDRGERVRRRPPVEAKPRPKRLRPQRAHRRAVLDTLEAHERPIADEVLRGGIPAVRQAVQKQNEQARAEGRPEVDVAQLEGLAERLLPRLRAAEWRDRAEAALADLDELDLRDLRTVVVAADSGAKDDEARALASQLREGLERRIEADQAAWLAELAELLDEGRVVRALRVSSRPPKAGAPLPPDLLTRLTEQATAALTSDTVTDRWITVLDALSLSPVHARVAPASVPEQPSDELKAAAASHGSRVPRVAEALGVEPSAAPPRRGPRRPARGGRGPGGQGGRPPKGGAASKGGAPGPGGRATRPIPPPPATDEQAPPPPTTEPTPEPTAEPATEADPADVAEQQAEVTPPTEPTTEPTTEPATEADPADVADQEAGPAS